MQTIEITNSPVLAATAFRALGTLAKRPGLVHALEPQCLVLPRVELDGGHIDRYATLCGFNAVLGVPLIYPQLLTFPLAMAYVCSDACPWPALGLVHQANHITQVQALRAGDVVRVEMQTGELFAHTKGQGFTLEFRILRGDALVWRATQSLLRLGAHQVGGNSYSSLPEASMPLSRQAQWEAPAAVGRRYASISGDHNPIHLHALSARLFGFKRAIAHGMWTAARALSCVLPLQPMQSGTFDVEFKSPLFLPGHASLWTGSSNPLTCFEVRDKPGVRVHLRAQLSN